MGVRALGTASLICLAGSLSAGGWHAGANNRCSDCHTMHNSEAGAPMRYDNEALPSSTLLRHASAVTLCIYCHDGSNTSSPDVIAPQTAGSDAAGGAFPDTWSSPTGRAHILGSADPIVPPGGSKAVVLTCVTCHAPHGSPSYRNLTLDPAGTGGSFPVSAKERVASNGSNITQAYGAANIVDKAGMSAWCGACHGNFHGRSTDAEGTASPWLRHPQDQAISGSARADYAYWLGTVTNRVRVQSPADDDVPSADDQVFCLSCHKAHGSMHRAAVIHADEARLGSTCAQCHNK
jgi:predicted CXXCH cytochrome family protein